MQDGSDTTEGKQVGYTSAMSTITPLKLASKGVIDHRYH
jgi:hypothetical protein